MRFWEQRSLATMSRREWESLCDGCGRCCLHKLEDESDGAVYYTRVACRYMDSSCRCSEYQRRDELVPDCVTLRPENVASFTWLPATCAYRLLAEGKPLYDWHPLISGCADSVHQAGISVRGRVLSEQNVGAKDMEEHVIYWVDQ